MCDVCDMAQSDQQIQECIHSIILEQSKPMHDSYPFEDSVEKEVQSVDIIDDTIQKIMKKIQADPDVFFWQCLLDIHGTKYSYGQPIFFIEHEEVTFGNFYDPVADYLESTLNYKYFILETPFDESDYTYIQSCKQVLVG